MAIVLHTKQVSRFSEALSLERADEMPAKYRETVFRCALAICGEPDGAEDVTQEVLLILVRSGERLCAVENPIAWVRKVTARSATRYLKRQKFAFRLSPDIVSTAFSADDLAVYQVLRGMSVEHRALLGMALNQGLSYREIGEVLDIPEGTVASRLSAAKKEFQKRWER